MAKPLFAYDIAAQPLDAALNAYIRSSGTQVLYETALTEGLTSNQVKGYLTADNALGDLLSGTGLVARRTDTDAFVIVPMPRDQTTRAAPANAISRPFMVALQEGVVGALCRTPLTRPGAYRVAIELWIGHDGAIQRASLVGSTHDESRDRALIAALVGAHIQIAPPPGSPQPFILSIGSRAPVETSDCAG